MYSSRSDMVAAVVRVLTEEAGRDVQELAETVVDLLVPLVLEDVAEEARPDGPDGPVGTKWS